jgi:hypothetical protein
MSVSLRGDENGGQIGQRAYHQPPAHSCASAITHKSQAGTYQAFAIDIGCYAHLRKLQDRFSEIDVSSEKAKEQMRSTPILDASTLQASFIGAPKEVEKALLEAE